MKQLIAVACAILEHKGKVLAVQRGPAMSQALLWEFPGGKLEAGEQATDCIIREIREELGINIQPIKELPSKENEHIRLIPFVCKWESGQLQLREHKAARWLTEEDFPRLNWSPADVPVWKEYLQIRNQKNFYG